MLHIILDTIPLWFFSGIHSIWSPQSPSTYTAWPNHRHPYVQQVQTPYLIYALIYVTCTKKSQIIPDMKNVNKKQNSQIYIFFTKANITEHGGWVKKRLLTSWSDSVNLFCSVNSLCAQSTDSCKLRFSDVAEFNSLSASYMQWQITHTHTPLTFIFCHF